MVNGDMFYTELEFDQKNWCFGCLNIPNSTPDPLFMFVTKYGLLIKMTVLAKRKHTLLD